MDATFLEYAKNVMEQRKEDGIRGVSREWSRLRVHLEPAAFAHKKLEVVERADVVDWLKEMGRKSCADTRGERRLSTATISRSKALVSAVFAAAVERGDLKTNPCIGVRVRKRADENSTKEKWAYLTLDEQQMLAACGPIPLADRLAIRFAIATGLRQGEQFNLELTDLHVGASPHVLVRFGSKGLPPKSGKIRKVPLFGDGLAAAREWLELLPSFCPSNPERLVFPTATGRRRQQGKPLGRSGTFAKHLRTAGIGRHLRWHDLRHTCATNLVTGALGRRWTLEEIQPLMGHSSIMITQRYSHVGETALVQAAKETAASLIPESVVNDRSSLLRLAEAIKNLLTRAA